MRKPAIDPGASVAPGNPNLSPLPPCCSGYNHKRTLLRGLGFLMGAILATLSACAIPSNPTPDSDASQLQREAAATEDQDIRAKMLSWEPENPRAGEVMTVIAVIANPSNRPMRRVPVRIRVSEELFSDQVVGLPADGVAIVRSQFVPEAAGRLEVAVHVDYELIVADRDRSNNAMEKTIVVGPMHTPVAAGVPVQKAQARAEIDSLELSEPPQSFIPALRENNRLESGDLVPVLMPASITVTKPSKDDKWTHADKTRTIAWTKNGMMDQKVDIQIFRPLVPFKLNLISAGVLAKGIPNSGSAIHAGWTSLLLCGGEGPYQIRVITSDGKVHGDSEVFTIGEAALTVTNPVHKEVWDTSKTYPIKWSYTGGFCDKAVDVALVPETTVKGTKPASFWNPLQTIWIQPNYQPAVSTANKALIQYQVPSYLQSGKYLLVVASRDTPLIFATREIQIKSKTVSPGTAFLGPDKPDLTVTDVRIDPSNHLIARIKNNGNNFYGKIRVEYESYALQTVPGQSYKHFDAKTGAVNGKKELQVNLTSTQDTAVKLQYMGGYPAGLDKYYTPEHGPLHLKVTAYPLSVSDLNFGDNTAYKTICGYTGPDIVTRPYLSLSFDKGKTWTHFSKWTTQNVSDHGVDWIGGGVFQARLYLPVYNYGCAWRSFDTYLYIDKQPGQYLGKLTLGPGQWTAIDKLVKIKAPKSDATYQMVVIADQAEHTDQPYPNSYMNNFVNTNFYLVADKLIGGS